uniref:O-acyltransferase WSD1 C-terminal domain-containing protein n=1 Tax=Rhizophora mucronata TaxID=61149 RepID=A0A2P2PYE0_RHIMU
MMGLVSYMGKLRVAVQVEKDFINPLKLKSHIENAFDMILNAALRTSTVSLAD